MRSEKRRKLKSRGWVVGDAADFLGLSAEEKAFVEMKVRLARNLRELRERRHYTQQQLASMIGSSQSRVAKLEAGDPSVTVDLMLRVALALNASIADIARMIIRGDKLVSVDA